MFVFVKKIYHAVFEINWFAIKLTVQFNKGY